MLLTLSLATLLQAAPAADTIPGSWRFQGDISGFPLNQVCTFELAGTALSGRCVSADGDADGIEILGEAKDGSISFQHGGEYEGEPLTVTYNGKVESATQMRGTILVEPFDVTGYFSATLVPKEEPQQ
jgi:hypothetical protein